jgi:hypothetical protein
VESARLAICIGRWNEGSWAWQSERQRQAARGQFGGGAKPAGSVVWWWWWWPPGRQAVSQSGLKSETHHTTPPTPASPWTNCSSDRVARGVLFPGG